jgi:(2S)-methylsuccinyl-CoA dehydrogenase
MSLPTLDDAARLRDAAQQLVDGSLVRAREVTGGGRDIDDHQVLTERVVYAATQARAAHQLVEAVRELKAEGRATEHHEVLCAASVAELSISLRARLEAATEHLGLSDADFASAFPAKLRVLERSSAHESVMRGIGRRVCETRGQDDWPLDELSEQVREAVRDFGDREVAPEAERIHRNDDLVPERFIREMAELGYFGLAIPEAYGGSEMGNLAMILTTEELSRASLAAAGSLITRPEILTKALVGGGTEAQKKEWLPKIAAGEVMVGISVTEPDIGSDVAGVKCRAEKRGDDYVINGPKAWCTFAGRADVLAVLTRTDPDLGKAARGLSLFIVPKDTFDGHDFEMVQPGGGKLVGKADATPGYRGMHSFTLNFEDFVVSANNLVGEAAGVGRGFYLQMAGFAAGRLQTGGRACGLAQAALEKTAQYVVDRLQFGKPLSERAITYAAALAMDEDERAAAPLAAQAKLLACDMAVELTQQGQLMHGGWGYAEEYPISRYVVDAQVLPIFEGVKPILELKVVGRSLLAE